MTLEPTHPAVKAATQAMEAHVKANSVAVPDTFGTGVSYAFNPSMEECLAVALNAALPHLPQAVAVLHGGMDAEERIKAHNEGWAACVAVHIAPDGMEDDTQEWVEQLQNIARAQGIRDAVAKFQRTAVYLTAPQETMARDLLAFADTIHPKVGN